MRFEKRHYANLRPIRLARVNGARLCSVLVTCALGISVLMGAGPVLASGADGTPDTSFSTGTGTGFSSQVRVVAVQSDGKIIVGGNFTTLNSATVNRIARLNADGTPDTTFTTNTGTGFNGDVYAVGVQSDGKIIIGGDFTTLNSATVNRIARLNADGTPDTTFTTNTGTGFNGYYVSAVAVQSDGKIIISGDFTTLKSATVNRIARLNADGTPDTTFTTNTGTGFNGDVMAVAVQSDGKIIIGGNFTTLKSATANFIARLNADGTPDSGFTPGTGFNGYVNSVAVQSNGKIIIGGYFTTLNSATVNRIARLDADGTPDTTFTTNTGTGFNNDVQKVAVQSNDKIIIGGQFTTLNSATINRIAQLNADGTLDTTFTTNTGTGFSGTVKALAVQSDDKIIVGGGFTTLNGATVNNIARLGSSESSESSESSGSSESGVPVFSLSFDSMPGVLISGAVGSWVSLPTLTNPPVTNPNSTFLGWTTYEEFPVAIAQRQIDNDWGAYEVFRDDGSLQDVFIPAEGSARIAAPESLYPIWSDSSA